MKKENRSNKVSKVQAAICSLLLILCFTIPSYSWVDNSAFKSEYQVLSGVSADNNVAFAFGRYVLIAPYGPSKPVTETTSKEELDNDRIYVLDAKKVNSEPGIYNLGCYYPTKVYFDPETQNAFVKGTEIIENPETGEYEPVAVIKYLHFNLPDNGKPVVDGFVQTIRIPGVIDGFASEAPDDFIVTGKYFLFTNGRSVYSYHTEQGYLYKVDFITIKDFDSQNNAITHLGFDEQSQVLSILTSRKTKGEADNWQHKSELYFYQLAKNGTINLMSKIAPEAFPDNDFVPPGSDVAINWDGEIDKDTKAFAYFAGASGVIYQTRWSGDSEQTGSVEAIAPAIDGLAQDSGEYLSTVNLSYLRENRTLEVLRNGYTENIHRPANFRGRLGKIHRPANLRAVVARPSLVLTSFDKKNRPVKQRIFTEEFAEEEGILTPFSDRDGSRYLASQKGNIFELKTAQVEDASISLLGQFGTHLGSVNYFRDVFVAVDSYQLGEDGQMITEGGVVIAKRRENGNFLSFVNWSEEALAGNAILGLSYGSIRRPCNTRPQ
jgi:hypothetical protein